MWQEYAIEPDALVRSLKEFNTFRAGLGWEAGRLLAQFPNAEYKRLVREALERSSEQPVKKGTILERLKPLYDKALVSQDRNAAPADGWAAQALAAHQNIPFHGIITLVGRVGAIGLDDFDPSEPPWSCEVDRIIPRTASELAGAAKAIFQHASEVVIVDPHFDPTQSRIATVLEAYLDARDHVPGRKFHLVVHASQRVLEGPNGVIRDAQGFAASVRKKVSPMLGSGQYVTMSIWEKLDGAERLHDRFIISDFGGLSIPGGTDTGPESETTIVTRLSAESARNRIEGFRKSLPPMPDPIYGHIHSFDVH
jgi:hypothetical protein